MGEWIRRTGRGPACLIAMVLAGALISCGGDVTTPPRAVVIAVTPPRGLIVGVGGTFQFAGSVLDQGGVEVPGATPEWESSDSTVATVSASGRVTAVAEGEAFIIARSGAAGGQASIEVYIPPEVTNWVVGDTHTSRNGYAEYVVGSLPIVMSAPHGGTRRPNEVADRTFGVLGSDTNTAQLARAIADEFAVRTGRRPHIVVSELHRSKLDPNREIVEAAQDDPFAELAWVQYHGFIDQAKALITADTGSGLYLDIHGHGHPQQRLELGYLLSSADLTRTDDALNNQAFVIKSSLRRLAGNVGPPFSALVRGPNSLGTLLDQRGVRAAPSTSEPDPAGEPFFGGGYSTARHGSRDGGEIDGIQVEHHFNGIRNTDANRRAYAATLVDALLEWYAIHFGVELESP